MLSRAESQLPYHMRHHLEACESEIERQFAAEVILYVTAKAFRKSEQVVISPSVDGCKASCRGVLSRRGMKSAYGIIINGEVGPYRPDLINWRMDRRGFFIKKAIIAECDGHAFHERTPEQAEHDKARDRYLQAQGFAVFRFTGREIHRDAGSAAFELFSAIGRAA